MIQTDEEVHAVHRLALMGRLTPEERDALMAQHAAEAQVRVERQIEAQAAYDKQVGPR